MCHVLLSGSRVSIPVIVASSRESDRWEITEVHRARCFLFRLNARFSASFDRYKLCDLFVGSSCRCLWSESLRFSASDGIWHLHNPCVCNSHSKYFLLLSHDDLLCYHDKAFWDQGSLLSCSATAWANLVWIRDHICKAFRQPWIVLCCLFLIVE